MSGGPHNTGLMRMLANRRMQQTADIYRNPAPSGGKTGAAELYAEDVPIHAYEPSTTAALQLLADLGSARANWIGEMAHDADVAEGDELRIAGAVFMVDRVVARPDLTLLALWEVRAT